MDYLRKTSTRECVWCKQTFHPTLSEVKRGNGRFCSLACVAYYRNEHYMKPRTISLKEYSCFLCGKKFERRPYRAVNKRQFCSLICFYKFNKGQRPGPLQRNVKRKIFKRAFAAYGEKCEICDYSLAVDVHHLQPRHQGGSDEEDNLAVLCPNHHREADLGILKPEDIRTFRK